MDTKDGVIYYFQYIKEINKGKEINIDGYTHYFKAAGSCRDGILRLFKKNPKKHKTTTTCLHNSI